LARGHAGGRHEGELAAAYLNEAMDRIGQVVPQEIPDDPQGRMPYTVFSHPAGAMVLAPAPAFGKDAAAWRFDKDTIHSARKLYTAIEDMPEVEGGALPDAPSTYMRLRRWIRDVSPGLFTRVGPLEAWQGVGVLALLAGSFAIAWPGASRRAESTVGTLDEIVVVLVMGALKLLLLTGGLMFIAQALSLPYEGVLAGLGGLAVAFASKETLSNVFGAGIPVADRPFRRGDWIEAGEAKGTVENVGIRSTRIRTGDDSLLVVPNGKLADATVNNLGTRRHWVFKAKLPVGHDTAPAVLVAFMDGLVGLTAEVPHVRTGSAKVGMAAIGPDGVEVELTCCLDVRTADDERVDRTALMLDALRLADRMRVRLGDQAPAAVSTLAAVAA